MRTDATSTAAPASPALPATDQADVAQEWMLTTIDNPFDPFTEYTEWNRWDEQAGYFTSNFLARVAFTSSDLSEADEKVAIDAAIDEIVRENVLGVYKKVSKESSDS